MQATPDRKQEHCAWCNAPILTQGVPIFDAADPTKLFCSLEHLYANYLKNGPWSDFDEDIILPIFEIAKVPEADQVRLLLAMDEWVLLMADFQKQAHHWYDCFFNFICRKYQVESYRHVLNILLTHTELLAYNPLMPIIVRTGVLARH